MSEELKNQLIYEIADELIQKFDIEISQEILTIINKHLYNYDVIEKQTSLIPLDSKTERILKMYIGTKKLEGKIIKKMEHIDILIYMLHFFYYLYKRGNPLSIIFIKFMILIINIY